MIFGFEPSGVDTPIVEVVEGTVEAPSNRAPDRASPTYATWVGNMYFEDVKAIWIWEGVNGVKGRSGAILEPRKDDHRGVLMLIFGEKSS